MRLYKPKEMPKQHRNRIDSPLGPPSSSPGSPTPHGLKRAAEAVGKQLSGHKAMVAQFKELRLPRPPIFNSKATTPSQTDRSHSTKQSKAIKGSGTPQNVSAKPPIPKTKTSSVIPGRRATRSGSDAKSSSPTKPPGLGSVKKPSVIQSAPGKSKSIPSPIHSSSQAAGALTAIFPTTFASTGTTTGSASATSSSDDFDVDQPLLSASCFRAFEEDPEPEDDMFEAVELSCGLEEQVARIFALGLGPTSDNEILRHGEIPTPAVTPEATFTSTSEPMSAVVEWWEPANNTTRKCESNGRSDEPETIKPLQEQVVCTPKNVPCQSPSSADYEYVAPLGWDTFRSVSLGIHKQSRRKYVIKVTSNAIAEEEIALGAILEEQRIMREVSGHPYLLGLMASFHDANGFYLVSEYCRSTLFDERDHMPEFHKKLASAELACAVDYLHNQGIIHRDIRLENVALRDGHVVLGDFGLALRLGVSQLLAPVHVGEDKNKTLKARGICGTLPYMAPEMLGDMQYSYGVDWFAYGVFLHVFYMDKFPWLGEHEHPASYLKEMMSTISIGIIFENGSFGDVLRKLLCVDQDARANFSVVRGSRFFADIDWQSLIRSNSPVSLLSPRPKCIEVGPLINIDHSESYPGFRWLNPSMIVDGSISDIGDSDWSPESSIAEPYTPSQFDAPVIEQSPVACAGFPLFDSLSLSYLYRFSIPNFDSEDHINDVLPTAARLRYEETPAPDSPASQDVVLEDAAICLGQGTAAMPADEDDDALVRMSIKSLDVGEEPIFDLPSGWKDAFVSRSDVVALPSSQAGSTKKTSMLPRIKSLWKRAASKFVSRPV